MRSAWRFSIGHWQRSGMCPACRAPGSSRQCPSSAPTSIEGGFRVEGNPQPPAGEQPTAHLTIATGGYFDAMRVPLRSGRVFSTSDHAQAVPVAVVNDLPAERFWPGGDPVGSRVSVDWQGEWRTMEVVGVVGRLRHEALDRSARAEVFMPLAQAPFGSMTFVVRTATDPAAAIPGLKARIWEIDPTLPLYDVATVDTLVSQSLAPRRFVTDMLGVLAGLAFLLAAFGIYGVVSFITAQRTREIGVRMAIGGSAGRILTLVVRDCMRLVAAGIVLGLLGSLAVARTVAAMLFEVSPLDPLTLAARITALATVALIACCVPARRATRIDPLKALRAE
jgi:predicted permease